MIDFLSHVTRISGTSKSSRVRGMLFIESGKSQYRLVQRLLISRSYGVYKSRLPTCKLASSLLNRSFYSSKILYENNKENSHGVARKSERAILASQLNLRAKLNTDSSKATFSEVKHLFELAGPYKGRIAFGVLLIVLTSIVSLSIPRLIGTVIDVSTSGETKIYGIESTKFFAGFFGLLVFGAICNFGRVYLMRIVGESIVARLRSRVYQKLMRQDSEFYDANIHGDIISRLSSDASIVGRSITSNIGEGFRGTIQCLFGMFTMLWISPGLTSRMLLIIPPIAILGVFYGMVVRKLSRQSQERLGDLVRLSEEKLANIRLIQSFGREKHELKMYNNQIRQLFQVAKKEILMSGGFQAISTFLANTTIILILILGGRMVMQGLISGGDLMSFFLYTLFVGGSLSTLSTTYSEIMKGAGAASRLFEILYRKPYISATIGKELVNARGDIEFRNVCFSYPTRPSLEIFQDQNFKIQSGDHVAICGQSGSGKSTILALLLRYYDITSGQILVDGTDIRDYSLVSLRNIFAVVGQDPVLFQGTIRDNIRYGKLDATDEEIENAALQAHCEFIFDLPDGFDTLVGNRGAQLSGGQRQRIAISRAFIRNPKILILDEATSALDGAAEITVDKALQSLISQKSMTTITIAHRLTTIKKADYIIVLGDHGSVVEIGTFDELCKPHTKFHELLLAKGNYADV